MNGSPGRHPRTTGRALKIPGRWTTDANPKGNQGALRLYERLDYRVAERRTVVPRRCHPHTGDLVLLTRAVA